MEFSNANRRFSLALGVVCVLAGISGCTPNTDVSPELNKRYHEHDPGPRPPAGAGPHGPPPTAAKGAEPKSGG